MNILREKAVTIKYKRNNEMYVKILDFLCGWENVSLTTFMFYILIEETLIFV